MLTWSLGVCERGAHWWTSHCCYGVSNRYNPERLTGEDGKQLKPGYNHGRKHHRGMGCVNSAHWSICLKKRALGAACACDFRFESYNGPATVHLCCDVFGNSTTMTSPRSLHQVCVYGRREARCAGRTTGRGHCNRRVEADAAGLGCQASQTRSGQW